MTIRDLSKAIRRATAARMGAFWLPCPVCREEFGGHEWRRASGHDDCIPELDNPRSGTGICPTCTAKGIGCYAQARLGDEYSGWHDCAETRRGRADRGEESS